MLPISAEQARLESIITQRIEAQFFVRFDNTVTLGEFGVDCFLRRKKHVEHRGRGSGRRGDACGAAPVVQSEGTAVGERDTLCYITARVVVARLFSSANYSRLTNLHIDVQGYHLGRTATLGYSPDPPIPDTMYQTR